MKSFHFLCVHIIYYLELQMLEYYLLFAWKDTLILIVLVLVVDDTGD